MSNNGIPNAFGKEHAKNAFGKEEKDARGSISATNCSRIEGIETTTSIGPQDEHLQRFVTVLSSAVLSPANLLIPGRDRFQCLIRTESTVPTQTKERHTRLD